MFLLGKAFSRGSIKNLFTRDEIQGLVCALLPLLSLFSEKDGVYSDMTMSREIMQEQKPYGKDRILLANKQGDKITIAVKFQSGTG